MFIVSGRQPTPHQMPKHSALHYPSDVPNVKCNTFRLNFEGKHESSQMVECFGLARWREKHRRQKPGCFKTNWFSCIDFPRMRRMTSLSIEVWINIDKMMRKSSVLKFTVRKHSRLIRICVKQRKGFMCRVNKVIRNSGASDFVKCRRGYHVLLDIEKQGQRSISVSSEIVVNLDKINFSQRVSNIYVD